MLELTYGRYFVDQHAAAQDARDPALPHGEGERPSVDAPATARTSVLIIDDNEALAMIAKLILERMGRIVHTAATGTEGRKMVERLQPDVVICDINLPDETGYEVLAALSANTGHSRPPFVFLTGGSGVDFERCQRLGAAAVLSKPCPMAELDRLVGRLHASAGLGQAAA